MNLRMLPAGRADAVAAVLVVLMAAAHPAAAQAPAPAPAAKPQPSTPLATPPQGTGTIVTRQPVVPAPKDRATRSFNRCLQEARNRRMRGAERRHFVASCRLGYGHRLFRGRGNPPLPPT